MNTDDAIDPLIDEAPSRYVIGIDLGTTNSAVTYVDTDESDWTIRILAIPQQVGPAEIESLQTLPSFHYQPIAGAATRPPGHTDDKADASTAGATALRMPWDSKKRRASVGKWARDETAQTSGRGIASAKSWLCHTAVDRTADLLPWHGAEDVRRLSPVEVSSEYLRHIRNAWDHQFPDFPMAEQDIVLTLPASFDEVARELTIRAAALAKLPRVVLIEEPQAAFYAWVYQNDTDWESQVEIGQKILICDIGGGTTDFTLIRVRPSSEPTDAGERSQKKVQFHRVAVGDHLILGGDNLDLAIAAHLENRLTEGGKLAPHQWDVLVGNSRAIKESMLSPHGPEKITVNLPGRGARLIGQSLQIEVTRSEIRQLILDGFLPETSLDEKPERHASGFQELGLPYAKDPRITRYLADFLVTHATAGLEEKTITETSPPTKENTPDSVLPEKRATARPDIVLFNGGFFASPLLRDTVVQRLSHWFQTPGDPDWQPILLETERLDMAVAQGAAYYGMVRRNQGVRIAASLARSYYVQVGQEPPTALCVMPGNAEPGDEFVLDDQSFKLTISQPVEFSLYVSSVRLADQPGEIIEINPEQLTPLPSIRTVLRAKSRNEKRELSVHLKAALTEIGTIDLSCHELDSDRSWKLQFDVRSATETDRETQTTAGESEGMIDESTWNTCRSHLVDVFGDAATGDPKTLVKQMAATLGEDRDAWPMPMLRRVWETLFELEQGRTRSAQHEARWLNLLGYSLRPGYGVAMDDWRVTETWRMVRGKLVHRSPNVQNEASILWRRVAGGLSPGQQSAIADPLLASLRALARKVAGKPTKGTTLLLRPEETVERWRLLGSLELLPASTKTELGNMIVTFLGRPKFQPARNAMIWALGRLGQRTPLYGPLNSVVPVHRAIAWTEAIREHSTQSPMEHLAVVQMTRRTDDRYRDISESDRSAVVAWLTQEGASDHLIRLVAEGGSFDTEETGRIFGEALPQGLRLA